MGKSGINYLFPPDEILNLPTWRFVLHFVVTPEFHQGLLDQAITNLKAAQWKIITESDQTRRRFCGSGNGIRRSVGDHVLRPRSLRRRGPLPYVWALDRGPIARGFSHGSRKSQPNHQRPRCNAAGEEDL